MAIKIDPRWAELQSRGYSLRDRDGDVGVSLYFKEAYITDVDFNQTTVAMDEVIREAEEHWQEITQDVAPKHCRDCAHWHWTGQWTGNCWLRRWDKDKYSQDAAPAPIGCKDYAARCTEAQVACAKE